MAKNEICEVGKMLILSLSSYLFCIFPVCEVEERKSKEMKPQSANFLFVSNLDS